MTNSREPPNQSIDVPFNQAVADVSAFFNFNESQLAKSFGTDTSTINRWQLTLADLDGYSKPAATPFKLDRRLLQRRILIVKLNSFHAFLLEHTGSEANVGVFLEMPLTDREESTSWLQLAQQNRGLENVCVQLEQWLKKNTDFSYTT